MHHLRWFLLGGKCSELDLKAQEKGGCCSSVCPGPDCCEGEDAHGAEHIYALHVSIYRFMYVMGHTDPMPTHRALTDSTNTLILFPSLAEQD